MKLAFGLAVFFWLLSGAVGAWMMDDLDRRHWKMIAKGPITLVKAIKENPVSVPRLN